MRQITPYKKTAGDGLALAIANDFILEPQSTVVFMPSIESAKQITQAIKFFLPDPSLAHYFPDWETLLYDSFSPQTSLINKRMEILAELSQDTPRITVAPLTTSLYRILPTHYFLTTEFHIKVGQEIGYEALKTNLMELGYHPVEQVLEPGEFATRGSIIDVFPAAAKQPCRIDLWGDEIESIKAFDPETQRSSDKASKVLIHGASEYPLTAHYTRHFSQQWLHHFPHAKHHSIHQQISAGKLAAGAEYFIPLFFNKTSSFTSYINEKSVVYIPENHKKIINRYHDEAQQRYHARQHEHPCLPPTQILHTLQEFLDSLPKQGVRLFNDQPNETRQSHALYSLALHTLLTDTSTQDPLTPVIDILQKTTYKTLIICHSETHKYLVASTLDKAKLPYSQQHTNWADFIQSAEPISLMIHRLSHGFILPQEGIMVITETDYMHHDSQVYEKAPPRKNPPLAISQINPGDYVVHEQYGIGQYQGLGPISGTEDNQEYLEIIYANDDKLYIPVSDIDQIYSYKSATEPELAKLGSKKWQHTRKKAIQKMVDSASEILALYSQRNLATAKQYQRPDDQYYRFVAEFPYQDTPDQGRVMAEIIDALCGPQLTDRLICGDVGFGKTEIAMRAAFLATLSGYQIVVIAPTTLLATQHHQTFTERFSRWPITIGLFTGGLPAAACHETRTSLASGRLDIVIATHKILSNDVHFHNLGLLIIDEEHRFGVRHKEKLKDLKLNVDVLSLTATPIPRSLQLACSNLRDLSIIATPPHERLPVQTYISEYDDHKIVEAVTREIQRGGQVYYLYNAVATMDIMATHLRHLLPDIRIVVAHGQMPKAKLDQAMTQFYHKRAELCLCSTIVESGIDIPNANTIIIDRADKLGLAQLHQIRGRVGRSSRQAYAYLFTPNSEQLTPEASQRLAAIAKHNYLGSGFQLALLDMEIRGAGELLGEEQSGHVKALGFDYYIRLIEETTTAIKNHQDPHLAYAERTPVDIHINQPCIIPDSYINNPATRLTLYKQLSHIDSEQTKFMEKQRLIDIYGKLPESCENLLELNLLKHLSGLLGVEHIRHNDLTSRITFTQQPHIDTDTLIALVKKYPERFMIQGSSTIVVQHPPNTTTPDQIGTLNTLLESLKIRKTVEKA